MAYTLATVRDRVVRDKLDDVSYDPAVVNRFINDAQKSIANALALPRLEKIFTGVLPVGEYIFEFPTDYRSVLSMVLRYPDGQSRDISDSYMDYRTFNERYPAPNLHEAGRPTVWTIFGGRLMFNVLTDGVYTLSLFYKKHPTTLTDDAHVPEIPEQFEELLCLGAFYRVLMRNEDYDLAAAVKQEYLEEMANVRLVLSERQVATPHIMGQPRRMRTRRL